MLTDEERNEIIKKHTYNGFFDIKDICKEIERAVLAKAMPKQEPIYMWRLEDDGWMDCTKEWFNSPMSEGYEKRIVYAQPAQAAAIPENFVEAFDHILELLEYVTDQPMIIPEPTDNTIMRSVKKIVTKLRSLSASPKPGKS